MIEISNLNKTFGSVHAVRGLSLHVPAGELFCFLGPNGAGKTTTIKIMTGLLSPSSGSVKIAGIDIQSDPVEVKKRLGYIPDMPYLYDRLTTTEFIEFTGNLYSIPDDKVKDTIDTSFKIFGLADYRNSLIKDLSHGFRQRLIYCASFLHNPEVLLIDEPLIGLDPYTIRLIKNMLKSKTRNGMTIFLTTHILALAEDIADRIGIILNGQLVALGSLKELLDKHGGHNLETVFLKLTGGRIAEEF